MTKQERQELQQEYEGLKLVGRLTNDPIFKTFFTLYLMAENEVERNAFNERFWQEVDTQNQAKKQAIELEFTQCFRKLPQLIGQSIQKISFERTF